VGPHPSLPSHGNRNPRPSYRVPGPLTRRSTIATDSRSSPTGPTFVQRFTVMWTWTAKWGNQSAPLRHDFLHSFRDEVLFFQRYTEPQEVVTRVWQHPHQIFLNANRRDQCPKVQAHQIGKWALLNDSGRKNCRTVESRSCVRRAPGAAQLQGRLAERLLSGRSPTIQPMEMQPTGLVTASWKHPGKVMD
jgi:hypothetical protein